MEEEEKLYGNNYQLRYEELFKKYKELEEQIEEYKLNVKEAMHEAQENARIFRREQAKANEYKKMIELMAEAFKQDDVRSKEEIIEHFRKKAKGE